MTIAGNRNLSNCENSPKKKFRGFNGIRTRGLCVSAAVLSQLSYEDPYTGGWPIYSINWPASHEWVFIAQMVEHCSANAEATGSNPVEAPKLFFGLFSQLLKLRFTAMVTYSFYLENRNIIFRTSATQIYLSAVQRDAKNP